MSKWGTDEESEFDFLDPNDPSSSAFAGAGGIGELPETPEGEPVPSVDDPAPDTFDLDGAQSDETGAVHLWLGRDGRLQNIRVSNRWRERLRGRSELSQVILETLGVSQIGFGTEPIPDLDEPVEARILDANTLEILRERGEDLADRGRALAERPPEDLAADTVEGSRVTGHSANRMVVVQLSVGGMISDVTIEEPWLGGARADDIGTAVMEAVQDAYAQHVPPRRTLGEFSRLAQEQRHLAAEILAMVNRGSR